jgi:hypothetical protein
VRCIVLKILVIEQIPGMAKDSGLILRYEKVHNNY